MNCNSTSRLEPLLSPKSIAILGASNNEKSIGGRPIAFLQKYGYAGPIYPINPKYEELQGLQCYRTINDLPEPVDLLIVTISAGGVYAALHDAVQKGIKAVVVFSSGFGELGPEGRCEQEKITDYARATGLIMAGPNCQGFINHWSKATATFTGALARENDFLRGNAAFCSQSGAMGGMLYALAQEMGIGFSYQITTGNEASVTMSDYMEYLLCDQHTKVVAAYLEGIKKPDGLRRCAELSMSLGKPVVAMKVGRSSAGQKAAVSHTGAMTGEDGIVDAFFRQHGLIRVDSTGEMLDCVTAFRSPKRLKGNRVGIISISGGAGVVMADACEKYGLEVATLSQETEAELSKWIPSFGSPRNPVDVTAQVLTESEKFYQCLRCVAEDPAVDAIVVFIGLLEHLQDILVPAVLAVDKLSNKPILVTWLANNKLIQRQFFDNHVPFYDDPTRCIYSLSQMNRFRKSRILYYNRLAENQPVKHNKLKLSVEVLHTDDGRTVDEVRSKAFLSAVGIPFAQEIFVRSENEAIDAAKTIGYPVAVKVVSSDIPHKSDAGGVKLNVIGDDNLRTAIREIHKNVGARAPGAIIEGFLIAEMLKNGIELFVGLKYDPVFGWVIATGIGGIFIEIFHDAATRVLPITRTDAYEMLRELKGFSLLAGARGQSERDIEAVVDILLSLAKAAQEYGDHFTEIDINPVIVMERGQGAKAVDALIVKC